MHGGSPITRGLVAAAVALALCASMAAAFAPRAAADGAPRPSIVTKYIPFGATRRAQTADYSQRHYHQHTCWLTHPRVVVLHYTAGYTWQSAWYTFAANTAYNGEKPGTSAHFIIAKNGTIIQAVPLSLRARHAIGTNHTSIGIEFVQEGSGHWADQQILARPAQMRAGLRLVRYLQGRFGIATRNVIGHAMANDAPCFRDYTGAVNHAVDWLAQDVRVFRSRL